MPGVEHTGRFLGTPVYLGESRTDDLGRLLFLGGRGRSESVPRGRIAPTFANNDRWFDDTSDGPVMAEVQIDGESIPVLPAWAATGPPNYAPGIVSIPTLYDVIADSVSRLVDRRSGAVSFTRHIYPLLAHLTQTQWVNYGFRTNGWGTQYDFDNADLLRRLNDKGQSSLRDESSVDFATPHPHASTRLPGRRCTAMVSTSCRIRGNCYPLPGRNMSTS